MFLYNARKNETKHALVHSHTTPQLPAFAFTASTSSSAKEYLDITFLITFVLLIITEDKL